MSRLREAGYAPAAGSCWGLSQGLHWEHWEPEWGLRQADTAPKPGLFRENTLGPVSDPGKNILQPSYTSFQKL